MLRFFVILFLSFTSSLHSQDTHIDNHVEDILLSKFFEDAFKKMGVPQNFKVDGLSNARKIQVSFLNKINDDTLIYQLNNYI